MLSVLATGGFYVARQETRIGVASERARTAFYLAEEGANTVMSEWDMSVYGPLTSWGTVTTTDTTEQGTWSVDVDGMSNRLFFLSSTGGATDGQEVLGGANRILGVVARLYTAEFDAPAAFTAKDQVRFVGKATVHGVDTDPPDWTGFCSGALEDKAGMLTDNASLLNYKDQNFDVTGNPPILEERRLVDEVFENFEGQAWDDLTAMATHTVSPRNFNTIGPSMTVRGICDTGNRENWGDPENPSAPCGNYFPMIHIKGAGNLQDQRGRPGPGDPPGRRRSLGWRGLRFPWPHRGEREIRDGRFREQGLWCRHGRKCGTGRTDTHRRFPGWVLLLCSGQSDRQQRRSELGPAY